MFDAAGRKKAGSDGVPGDFEQALSEKLPFPSGGNGILFVRFVESTRLEPIPESGVHRLRRQNFRQEKPNPPAILYGLPEILVKHGGNYAG